MLFVIFLCFIILLSIVSDARVNWLLYEYVYARCLKGNSRLKNYTLKWTFMFNKVA